MVRTSPDSPKRHQTNGFLLSITALVVLLAKRASRLSGKPKDKPSDDWKIELRSTKSPLARPKKLLSNISNKRLPFIHHKKKDEEVVEKEEWGDGGIWQKAILMGDKCQPLDFSGVIYYDSKGQRLKEIPFKSPRASPMPGYLSRPREQKL
ncbi:hypothetical protein L6164_011320 [Bauhinia variegata]|uniref:Uncharacterized protein n=1 Tax=Bauhinia variegata TaxID=167791 RepID=A0ACB9PAQ6_BAUVA|nr:hypothetical protein L6164_011320 [Bauhinia variegata]